MSTRPNCGYNGIVIKPMSPTCRHCRVGNYPMRAWYVLMSSWALTLISQVWTFVKGVATGLQHQSYLWSRIRCIRVETVWGFLGEGLRTKIPRTLKGLEVSFLFFCRNFWMPALSLDSSSSLEHMPVPSSTWVSIAVSPLSDVFKNTPVLLPRGTNPKDFELSSRSSCQTRAASGSRTKLCSV